MDDNRLKQYLIWAGYAVAAILVLILLVRGMF